MSRWFRVYDDLVDDPKVQRLPDASFKALVNLWCLASQNGGRLPPIEDICFKLRIKPDKGAALIAGLKNAGLIDEDETGDAPHNWNGRQFKSDVSNDRVKRHRERKCNVTDTVTVTPPDTEQNTEQSRKKETREVALSPADDWPSDFRERFWNKYPNKVGKPDALKKLDRVRKTAGVPWAELWGGLERYVAKTDDRPWCNPATWIHQQRWADQPANGGQNGSGRHAQANLSVPAAADRILERIRELDAPQQANEPDCRDRARETHGRLLSEVRGGGSGDVPDGPGGGPRRVLA
jgi:hypothetical protein